MSKFVIASFYTQGNGYDVLASRLTESLKPFAVDSCIEAVEDSGNWIKNAQYTHRFLREMLDRFPGRPIVWTDADSIMRRYPELFDELDCDFAAHTHEWRKWGRRELLCGTMFFGNTDAAKGFLDECVAVDERWPNRRGAYNVAEAFEAWRGRLRFVELPAQYCKIFDLMAGVQDPVFEHFQASRAFRRKPAKFIVPPLATRELREGDHTIIQHGGGRR